MIKEKGEREKKLGGGGGGGGSGGKRHGVKRGEREGEKVGKYLSAGVHVCLYQCAGVRWR